MTPITDAERKLQTQINLLTTTNEVLAEKLAAAETAHATELAAYELTVENLTAERAELQARVNQQASMVEKCIEEMNRNADIGARAGKERDALAERVKALEAAAQAVIDRWDTPMWKEAHSTAIFIASLNAAIKGTP